MVLGILIGACMPFGFGLCSRPWVPVQVNGSSPWSQHHLPGLQAMWLHDHLGAWPRLGRRSAGTHPHSRPGLCGRSVDVDASDTHATATSSVCEPFQGTERVSATNFPGMGRGGAGCVCVERSGVLQHVLPSSSTVLLHCLGNWRFLQSLPILASADKTAWRLSCCIHPEPGPQHPMQRGLRVQL